MPKRRREKVSDDTITAEDFYTAFVDTSLGTHLAMMISSSDTVSDLKKKIALEHFKLFPGTGEIKVLSLQVKRLGHFYHLPDSMLVFSAYEGSKRHKFLYVDASSSKEPDREQQSSEPASNAQIPNAVQASPRNLNGETSKAVDMEVSHTHDGCQEDLYSGITRKLPLRVSKGSTDDSVRHIQLENLNELSPESGRAAKKKKTDHHEKEESGSRHMQRSGFDHQIETAAEGANKNVAMMTEVKENEVNGEFGSTLDMFRIETDAALKSSQSEHAVEKSLNVGTEEYVGDHSHCSKQKKVTKMASIVTDEQENTSVTNAASEQLKDNQQVVSLVSKKQKKRRERTSLVVPSDQATFSESSSIQNIEEEKNFKGDSEVGCKVVDKLSDLAIDLGEQGQPETFSGPYAFSQKGFSSDNIDKVLEGSKGACSLDGNVDGKMSTVDQTVVLRVNGDTSSMLQSAVIEDSVSAAIIGKLNGMNKVSFQVHDESIHLFTLDSASLLTDRKAYKDIKLNQEHEFMPSESFEALDQGDANRNNAASTITPKPTETTSEPMETVFCDTTKRNKKKMAKMEARAAETNSVAEQNNVPGTNSSDKPNLDGEDRVNDKTDENDSTHLLAETNGTKRVEQERGLSDNPDAQGKTNECLEPRDCAEAEVPSREAAHSSDLCRLNEVMNAGNSTSKKKKRRKMEKSAAKFQGVSGLENDLDGVSSIFLSGQYLNFNNQMTGYDKKIGSHLPCMGTDQNTAVLGGKQENMIPHSGPRPRPLGETNININQSATASVVSDGEDVKSSDRRKKKRTKKSALINQDGPDKELVETLNDHSVISDETKNCLDTLPHDVWNASKDESMDTSAIGENKEGNKVVTSVTHTEINQSQECEGDMGKDGREVHNDSVNSVDNGSSDLPVKHQTNEVQGWQQNESGGLKENGRYLDKVAKKKKKKNRTSENIPTSEIKERSVVAEDLATLGNKMKGKDSSASAAKTNPLAEETVVQSTAPVLGLEKNPGIEPSSNHEHVPKAANPSQVLSKGKPETEIDTIENVKSKDESINFRHYFVPGEHQDKGPSSIKVKEKLTRRKNRQEKHNVVAEEKVASENHGIHNNSDGRNIEDNRFEEHASSDEHNKTLHLGIKNTLKASGQGVGAPSSHEVKEDKTLKKATIPVVLDGSGGNLNASKRKQQLGISHNNIPKRNSSGKSSGNVLNSSGRKKSSLFTPRLIFRQDSSESSSDENEIVNSDAKTHVAADSSSSLGHSDGESEPSLESKRNGRGGAIEKILDEKFSGPEQMDMILRNSNRFRKAKLAASQSRAEDAESQPVGFCSR